MGKLERRTVLILLFALVCAHTSIAQDESKYQSIDSIVLEPLNIISGDQNEVRDWEAFRDLFKANAQFAVLSHDTSGNSRYRHFNLEEFVRIGRRGYEKHGFLETELAKTVDEYNGIAHVFQSYYAKGLREEKGINSFQLVYDNNRWWITSILWTSNENGVPLPVGF